MTWKETQSAEQPQNGRMALGAVWFGGYSGMRDGGLWGNTNARWAMSFSDWSSLQPETGIVDLGVVGFFFILSTNHLTGMHAKSLQSYLTLCNPMECRWPGSSVHGILQTRILEWVAMPSSRGSSPARDWTHLSYVSCIYKQVLYH